MFLVLLKLIENKNLKIYFYRLLRLSTQLFCLFINLNFDQDSLFGPTKPYWVLLVPFAVFTNQNTCVSPLP